MPYSKTWKKGSKKKFVKAKGKNNRQDQRIKKLEQTLYPSIEYKTKDNQETDIAVSTGGASRYPLFKCAQGTEIDQRVGDKVTLQRMSGQVTVTRGDQTNMVRLIIVATPSSTQLSMTDVLEFGLWSPYAEQVFSSPYKIKASSTSQTYKILYDKVYNIPNTVLSLVDKFELDLRGINKQLEFSAIGSTSPNNLLISALMISDSTAVNHPVVSMNIRTKFYDL